MEHTLLHPDSKSFWRLINIIILTSIGLFGGGSFLGIASLKPIHILTALATIFLLTLLGNMTLRGRLLGFAGILLILFGAGAAAGFRTCLSFLQSYFRWLTGSFLWNHEYLTGYEMIQTIFLTLLCCLLQTFMEKDFRIKAATLLTLLAVLLYCLLTEKELSRLSVAFILCYTVIIYVEWTQLRWKKEKLRSTSSYMLWVMPFVAVYFLLMLMPRVPEEPYDWQIVKNAWNQLRESFLKISYNFPGISNDDYDLSLSGFSDRSGLGSRSLETDHEIMTIQSKTRLATNIYLTGKVYDTFNGRGWIQQNEDTSKERYMDSVQTLYAVQRYDKDYLTDYLSQIDITVNYRYFRSEFLFAPLKAIAFKQNSANLNFQESGGSLYFNRRRGYGTEYDVSFYQLNAGQEAFHQFLNSAELLEPDEEELQTILRTLKSRTGEDITVASIQDYRQIIYDNYLEDITLSDETAKYLQKITEGAETDVDKLRAIERELSTFTYTHTPGPLPETVTDASEFLDYFLLESREGYCNYFATAFTLLARAEGIPARFVQGFCVPSKGKTETTVYSDMSHAWPEVYLDEIGWIPFEPTPGYSQTRYTSWAVKKRNSELSSDLKGQSPEAELSAQKESDQLELEPEGLQESVIYPERNNLGRIFWIAGLILLSCLSISFILLLFNLLISRYRYQKMSVDFKFKTEISRNLRILSLIGINRKEEETLSELKEQAVLLIGEKEPLQFLDSYEDFLYGDKEIGQESLEKAKRQQSELLQILKQRKQKAYFWYRILAATRLI